MLFRTNGQSETYEQALSDAGIPYLLRGGERFFDRPEVREARLLLRGAARSADSEDLPATVRAVLSGGGWSATPPEGGGAVRERWESLAALARLADDLTAVTPAATAARLRRRAGRAGRRAARAHRRRRDAGVAARGEGAGVGRRVRGRRQRGHAADHLRRDARAGGGGTAAALRRGDPGPRAPVGHLGAGPLARRPRQPATVPVPGRPAQPRRPSRPRRPGPGAARAPRPAGSAARG